MLGDVEDPATLTAIEGPFDYIVLADTIGVLEDIDGTLRLMHQLCAPSTRIDHRLLLPSVGTVLKSCRSLLRNKQPQVNYIATADFLNLMDLADFEVISQEQRHLLPRRWLGLGPLHQPVHRAAAGHPAARPAHYLVGRPVRLFPDRKFSASILIPCRNERGNIENAIRRMPRFGSHQEIIFVEGNSSDGTFEECERVRDAYKGQLGHQGPEAGRKGKGERSARALPPRPAMC